MVLNHGKELVDSVNAIEKRYIHQLMSNIQLTGSKTFDSQILMYYFTQKNDVSLAKKLQKHLSMEHGKHGVINQVKYSKISSKRKWTDIEYHIQDNADIAHKDVKMYCETNQLPSLPFCGPHPKPHGARGLSKYYCLCFDPKLGHGICTILHVQCACVGCTPMLDKRCIYGIPSKKQARYQTVTNCTYWPVLRSYKNLDII